MTELRQVMWTQMLGFLDCKSKASCIYQFCRRCARTTQKTDHWATKSSNLVLEPGFGFTGPLCWREDRPRQPELQVSFRCLHESEISELRIWLDVRQQQLSSCSWMQMSRKDPSSLCSLASLLPPPTWIR